MILHKGRIFLSLRTMLLILFFVFLHQTSQAQHHWYRITFTDKGNVDYSPGSPSYNALQCEFDVASVERRKRIGLTPLFSEHDAPIFQEYLADLADQGIVPHLQLRWRNSIVCLLTDEQHTYAESRKYVKSISRVSSVGYPQATAINDCSPPRAGELYSAHTLLNTLPLLESGLLGSTVNIALIDNGFRWQSMSSLTHLSVYQQFDFVQNDTVVSNEAGEPGDQDGHGSLVLSVVASWLQDTMIGIAPAAHYMLYKTEDMRYERRIEEDAFTAAVEVAERQGAMVLSASVGYYTFDSTEDQTRWEYLDGKTTFASQALNRATMLGMVTVVAAGNAGPDSATLILPADADSAITVGAYRADSTLWPNSSRGPNAAGKIKPDVVALGADVITQNPAGVLRRVSGTSMAAPQIAGLFALLSQLFPEATGAQLRQYVLESCSDFGNANNSRGNGIPDAVKAARITASHVGPGIGPFVVIGTDTAQLVLASIFSPTRVEAFLQIQRFSDTVEVMGEQIDSLWYGFLVPRSLLSNSTFPARLVATNNAGTRFAFNKPEFTPLPSNGNSIPCGVRLPGTVVSVMHYAQSSRHGDRVWPNPISRGDYLNLSFAYQPVVVQFVETSSGRVVHKTYPVPSTEGWRVQVPYVHAGHYHVVVLGKHSMQSYPVIVE